MSSATSPYILFGASHSLYTGKARCYLRNQGIAYVERPSGDPEFASRIVPQIGRGIIPVLETPDGAIIQDTIDIIDYFEKQGVPYPAYPQGPLQRVVAVIIEYYGGQAMLKQAMHYRWSYREQQEGFLRHAFASGSGPDFADKVMGRMQSYLPRLGVTEQSIPHIERSYETLLDLLDEHFKHLPYLLGGRPCIADYGLIASMFAHLGRDPVPEHIMKTRAPRVYRWVERMTAPGLDTVEYVGVAPELLADDQIPASLEPVLKHIAADIFPELTDKLAFIDEWVKREQPANAQPVTDKPQQRQLGLVKTHYHDAAVEVGAEPYLMFVLQRAVDAVNKLDAEQASALMDSLRRYGLEAAVPLGRDYTVGRKNNIEVWLRG